MNPETISDALRATLTKSTSLVDSPLSWHPEFCHYTSVQGLFGMIHEGQIWLSDHRFVNDPREYSYGKDLTVAMLTQTMAAESDPAFAGFLGKVLQRLREPSSSAIYIASMSLAADKLDQWKGYGGSPESVCVVFEGGFDEWNAGNSHPSHLQQHRIIYDADQQKNLVKALIENYREALHGVKHFDYPFVGELASFLESQFIRFKHKEYASEAELRLTIANLRHILDVRKPRHRIARGVIVPYITTQYIAKGPDAAVKRLPIKEVITSPTSRPELKASLQTYLANVGYPNVPVHESTISFRG